MKKKSVIATLVIALIVLATLFVNNRNNTHNKDVHKINQEVKEKYSISSYQNEAVVQDGQDIYYSRGDKDYSIYRKTINGKRSTKISDKYSDCLYIDGTNLFYRKQEANYESIIAFNIKTEQSKIIYTGTVNAFVCYGKYLYFLDDNSIRRLDKDGSNMKKIIYAKTDDICICHEIIYYYDYYHKNINCVNVDGTNHKKICDAQADYITVYSDYIYYLDGNIGGIKRIDCNGKKMQNITNNVPEKIFVKNDKIYYDNGTQIRSMDIDGKNDKLIYDTKEDLIDFSITENAIFYQYSKGKKFNETLYNKLVIIQEKQ